MESVIKTEATGRSLAWKDQMLLAWKPGLYLSGIGQILETFLYWHLISLLLATTLHFLFLPFEIQ